MQDRLPSTPRGTDTAASRRVRELNRIASKRALRPEEQAELDRFSTAEHGAEVPNDKPAGSGLTPARFREELRDANRYTGGSQGDAREAVANVLGGGEQASGSLVGESERDTQKRSVVDWAKANGRALRALPRAFNFNSPNNKGQTEHDVWFDAKAQRWLKVSKPSFGVFPSVKNGKWTLGRTSPAQYLTKLAGLKELFGIETPVHGVLLDIRDNPSFIISQPTVRGTEIDETVIEKHFREDGFLKIADDAAAYYRPSDNTAVFDAHPGNVVEKEGKLVGFDAIVIHPTGDLRALLEADYLRAAQRRPKPLQSGSFLDQARAARAPGEGAPLHASKPQPSAPSNELAPRL